MNWQCKLADNGEQLVIETRTSVDSYALNEKTLAIIDGVSTDTRSATNQREKTCRSSRRAVYAHIRLRKRASCARVAKWQTQRTQNPPPQGVPVQVRPRARAQCDFHNAIFTIRYLRGFPEICCGICCVELAAGCLGKFLGGSRHYERSTH